MAVLTDSECGELRRAFWQGDNTPCQLTKAEAKAVFQAIEDWFQQYKNQGATWIENAAPGKLTTAQKYRAFAMWMEFRQRMGVS